MSPMRALLLSAAVLVSAGYNNAGAADLYGGSIKDGGYAPVVESARRSFYLRLDGGYSWAGQPDISETQVCGSCSTTYDLTETNLDDTWTLGGGVEYAFTQNWVGRLEYRFSSFGNFSHFSPFVGPTTQRINDSAIRAGIAYKFGGGYAPVVAKY